MKKFALALLMFIVGVVSFVWVSQTFGAGATETLTFQWNQDEFIVGTGNLNLLKDWRIYWKDKGAAEFDQTPIAIVPYDSSATGNTFTSPATAEVTGSPGTTVNKVFTAVACGDIPQQDGTTKYECSGNSNEVEHSFWIPVGQFSVPIQFQIKTQ